MSGVAIQAGAGRANVAATTFADGSVAILHAAVDMSGVVLTPAHNATAQALLAASQSLLQAISPPVSGSS